MPPRCCLYEMGTALEIPPTHPPPPTVSIPPQSLPWYMIDGGVPEEVMRFERLDRGEGMYFSLVQSANNHGWRTIEYY